MADKYSIRDLEELSGIPAHTIRTWERRYRLFSPARDASNVRCYFAEDMSYLHHLVVLLKHGHRISTLACKSRAEIEALVRESALTAKDSDVTEAFCIALKEFDATKIESMMNCFIRKDGFDQATVKRFVPFLDQISFLLLSGVLEPVQVQIFYFTFRQKIHAALDAIPSSREGEKWVLVHDDDIVDTIYLDMMHYLLRKAGRQIVVAGATNAENMQTLLKGVRPKGHCLVAAGERAHGWLQKMLAVIPVGQGNTIVLIPGKTPDFVNSTQMQQVRILKGLPEALAYLSEV